MAERQTEHGTGRSVPLNQRALTAMREWAQQFPDRKRSHCVFPSERVGFSGNDEIPQVFDTQPSTPITSWRVAWTTARTNASVSRRFHDLRHTVVTRLEKGQPFRGGGRHHGLEPWNGYAHNETVRTHRSVCSPRRDGPARDQGEEVRPPAEQEHADRSARHRSVGAVQGGHKIGHSRDASQIIR